MAKKDTERRFGYFRVGGPSWSSPEENRGPEGRAEWFRSPR